MNRMKAALAGLLLSLAAIAVVFVPSQPALVHAQQTFPKPFAADILDSIAGGRPWITAPPVRIATFTAGTTDFRAQIQTQWDAAAAAGVALLLPAGTYPCTTTGSGTSKCCLQPGTAGNFYRLLLAPGAVLKIADSQGADGAYCNLIRAVNQTGGLYIGWPYGGRGGTLNGNTANQAGWTIASGEAGTKYGQSKGYSAVYVADTLGGGSRDVTVENVVIDDFFSNSIVIGYASAVAYGNGTQRVYARGIKTTGCGEGIVFNNADFFGMIDCEDIRTVSKMQGDSFEPAFCRYGMIDRCVAHTNGVDGIGGGAGIDAYGSRYLTISDCVIDKCSGGITLQSDATPTTGVNNYCDQVTITNCVIRGGAVSSGYGILPSEGGRTVISNCAVENCAPSGLYLVAQTVTDGSAGCDLQMDNVKFSNCGTSYLDCTTGNLDARLSNVWFGSSVTSDYGLIVKRDSGAKTMNLNLIGVGGSGMATSGLLFNGATFRPTGKISGMKFNISGGVVPITFGSTADLRSMQVEGFGVLKLVSATASFTHHGADVVYWDNAAGALSTLNPGTIYQQLTISFMFGGGTVNHMVGNIRLRGGVNQAFAANDTLTLRWLNQTSEWVQQ